MEAIQKAKAITFMLIDLDYQIERKGTAPKIRLFGKTKDKNIQVIINDFQPYFYITKKKGYNEFIKHNKKLSSWFVKSKEEKKRRYFGGKEVEVVKIIGTHPEETPAIRDVFAKEGFEIHEADIPFVKRFLIDTNIRCLNVYSVKIERMEEKGNNILVHSSSNKIKPVSLEGTSADYFYKLKIMAFDIEVNHQGETIQQLLATKDKRITAISYVLGTEFGNYEKKVFVLKKLTDEDESQIINNFLDELNTIQPDALITFNGDNFDLPYLLERMAKLNIPNKLLSQNRGDNVFYSQRYRTYRIKGRISYDISYRTWGIHPVSGKKGLGDIAETILGISKVVLDRTTGEIWESGFIKNNKDDQRLLIDYSLRDSVLTYQLFWKLGVIGWFEVIRLTGYPAGEAPGSTERIQGEFELMRFCYDRGVLIPMTPDDDEVNRRGIERKRNPHTGGTVLIPKGTLHVGVIISDFRSMYPSVCVAHNIGGESLKKMTEIRKANPLEMFNQKPQSCLSLMEETLITRREVTKEKIAEIEKKIELTTNKNQLEALNENLSILDKEQYSLKIVANSMYGAHNYIRSRFYSITLGNAITNIARTYILRMEELLTKVSKKIAPVEIIYGDTDSAFIKLLNPQIVIEVYNETDKKKREKKLSNLMSLVSKILLELNDQFPPAMELTLEDVAYKLIFKPGRAKAYSYYSLLNNKLHITGFEAVRSDWSYLSREAQKKVLELILTDNVEKVEQEEKDILNAGLEKAREYLINLSKRILEMPVEQLIPKTTILSPIKKKPSNYKSKVPGVLAFLHYTKKEGLDPETSWKEFDKFPWVVTPGSGIISERARHPKYAQEIDREHYITEILRSSEGFGIQLTLQDIKNIITTEPIDEIFKRLPKEDKTTTKDEWEEYFKREQIKQTKLSSYIINEENEENDNYE